MSGTFRMSNVMILQQTTTDNTCEDVTRITSFWLNLVLVLLTDDMRGLLFDVMMETPFTILHRQSHPYLRRHRHQLRQRTRFA